MPETAAFCPGCGRSMAVAHAAREQIGMLRENVAGALAYLTFIPAIVFLSRAPYNKNPFVRFHSIQCLLLWVAALATGSAIRLAGIVLFLIPIVGPLFVWLVSIVAGLAAFVLWLVLVVKALQGQDFKLPLLGDFAAQHADSF
jgi:uncharacterized membrane protein